MRRYARLRARVPLVLQIHCHNRNPCHFLDSYTFQLSASTRGPGRYPIEPSSNFQSSPSQPQSIPSNSESECKPSLSCFPCASTPSVCISPSPSLALSRWVCLGSCDAQMLQVHWDSVVHAQRIRILFRPRPQRYASVHPQRRRQHICIEAVPLHLCSLVLDRPYACPWDPRMHCYQRRVHTNPRQGNKSPC
jgi:hypothetical protein